MPDVTEPADVSFAYVPDPKSFFYELRICFGERCEEVGGFDPGGGPDGDLLRAALWVLLGGGEAHVRMDPVQPWGVRLTFREVFLGRERADGPRQWGCEVSRTDLDGNNEPESEPRLLGIAPSAAQLCRALLAYAERSGPVASPSYPLLAMRAALPLIEEREAARTW